MSDPVEGGKAANNEGNEEEEVLASDQFTTEQRQKQMEDIENEINSKPLVGWLEKGWESMVEEFKANSSFARKIPYLAGKYVGLRRIRGDGNCFYRGYTYQLVKLCLEDKALYVSVKAKIDSSMDYLKEVGYKETEVEYFIDEVKRFFGADFPKNEVEVDTFFADKGESMCLIWFMRLLAAGFIKHHWAERFCFFAGETYIDAADYCSREVEPSERECEQIPVTAVCEYFGVRTCVEYLDQNPESDETQTYHFGSETGEARIFLLYKPGHYDILCK